MSFSFYSIKPAFTRQEFVSIIIMCTRLPFQIIIYWRSFLFQDWRADKDVFCILFIKPFFEPILLLNDNYIAFTYSFCFFVEIFDLSFLKWMQKLICQPAVIEQWRHFFLSTQIELKYSAFRQQTSDFGCRYSI